MRRLMVLGLLALGVLAFAPAAYAGCAPVAWVTNYDAAHARYAGHGHIHCTTNNGTNYRLVIYAQGFRDDLQQWETVGTPSAFTFSNGGLPMPDNYTSSDKVDYTSCAQIANPAYGLIRTHLTLENTITHTVGYDDYQTYTPVHNGTNC